MLGDEREHQSHGVSYPSGWGFFESTKIDITYACVLAIDTLARSGYLIYNGQV